MAFKHTSLSGEYDIIMSCNLCESRLQCSNALLEIIAYVSCVCIIQFVGLFSVIVLFNLVKVRAHCYSPCYE